MGFDEIQQWLDARINIWQLFGYLNVLVSTGFLLFMGFKRGWDITRWTLLVTSFVFGTGLGTMILPSIMGALLGGLLVFLLVKHLIQFPHATADLFAIYMILFIGIGRLGCLFSGCCFGTPTNLPWGISYGLGNLTHWLHFHTGQLNDLNNPSLMIHPVQLYESLFLLLGALPVVLHAQRRNVDGRIILSGFISSYFVFRFGIEFIRDMSNVWWSEVYLGPVSLFQIFLLGISGLSLLYASLLSISPQLKFFSVKHFDIHPEKATSPLFFTMLMGSILLSIHFQRIQIILLLVLLTGLIYRKLLAHFASQSSLNLRFSPQTVGIFGLLLLVSTNTFLASPDLEAAPLVSNSKWLYGINEHNQKLVRLSGNDLSFESYTFLRKRLSRVQRSSDQDRSEYTQALSDLNQAKMTYYAGGNVADYSYTVTGCGGSTTTHYIEQSGILAGLEYTERQSLTEEGYLGARLSRLHYNHRSSNQSSMPSESTINGGILYGGMEWKYIGLGFGLSSARIHRINYAINDYDQNIVEDYNYSLWGGPIDPGGYLRVGPRMLFAEIGYNDRYFSSVGTFGFHVNAAMITSSRAHLQFGFSSYGTDAGEPVPFIGVRSLPIYGNLALDLSVLMGFSGNVALRYTP